MFVTRLPAQPTLAPLAAPSAHAPVASRADASELETRIAASGCAAAYYALEECLGEHARSWAACRAEVHALRACNERERGAEAPGGGAAPRAAD